MAGTWPNQDCSDLEVFSRILFNEATAAYVTQDALRRWLSVAAKEIAQEALCVRRILFARASAGAAEVAADAYKVHHVEYLPDVGRGRMLRKITPLMAGNVDLDGVEPQYWYPYGANVGIEPVPPAGTSYRLRLYVSDRPKIRHTTWPFGDLSAGWTETAGHDFWTNNVFQGEALNDENTVEMDEALSPLTSYTVALTVTNLADAQLTVLAGTTISPIIDANGIYTVTLTSSTGTPKLALNGRDLKTGGGGMFAVSDIYLLKEADFAASSDQVELPAAWQTQVALRAAAKGLGRQGRSAAAQMLEAIAGDELQYQRQTLVEVIPDGINALTGR